jgi:hypothetical protein
MEVMVLFVNNSHSVSPWRTAWTIFVGVLICSRVVWSCVRWVHLLSVDVGEGHVKTCSIVSGAC